jgi:hypothetical protein
VSTAGPGLAPTSPPTSLQPTATSVAVAAALAGAVLAGTSIGSMVVAALLVGVATADRRAGGAALLAVVATAIRFRTANFDDLAGIQSVLGPAGTVGPATAAASAWAGGVAVVLAATAPVAGRRGDRTGRRALVARLFAAAPAPACGLLAAALVAGPGPSELDVRIAASVLAVALAVAATVAGTRPTVAHWGPRAALVSGVASVVLAGWPS